VRVKEYTSELVDAQRQWTAVLGERRKGRIRLAVGFQQRLDEREPKDFLLPLVRAANVEYQSAIVAVEGHAEYHIDVNTHARKVDVGELVDADYQASKRLLGAYSLSNAGGDVRIDVTRRPGFGLPSAIVQRAELVTLVSTSGKSQTAARFLLRSKAAYLEVTLPKDPPATLWSAVVDGKPSTPQREGNSLLLSLPPSPEERLRDVQLVYETPVAPLRWMGSVETNAPQLALRDESGEQRFAVPVADVRWNLILPAGHRMVRSTGTVFPVEIRSRTSPLLIATGALFEMAGGLQSRVFLARQAASEARFAADYAILDSAAPAASMAGTEVTAESEPAAERPEEEMLYESEESAPAEAMLGEARKREDRPALGSQAAGEPASPAPADDVAYEGFALDDRQALRQRGQEAARTYWALEGVRSLQIDLIESGEKVVFQSMGIRPRLRATLVNEQGLNCLAWGLALLVGLIGVAMTGQSVPRKARFIVETALAALLLPLVIGWLLDLELQGTFEPAFYTACLLVPYYLLVGGFRWCLARLRSLARWFGRHSAAAAATSAVLFLTTAAYGQAPALSADDLLDLLDEGPPVVLPADAVIIPYDPHSEDGVKNAEKVLIPYKEYEALWNRAYPDQPLGGRPAPAPYALAGASYEATLLGDEFLEVRGRLTIQTLVEEAVEIPLALEGGVLTQVLLDGQPAQISVVQPKPGKPAQRAARQQRAQPQKGQAAPAPRQSLVVLQVQGKGRKQLELAARLRLDRSGGWRIARGRLPVAPATRLTLSVPQAHTEVRLSEIPDRDTQETQRANETLDTALAATGRFAIQWRPTVAVGQVDQSLTARSVGLLDVQEDGLRLFWQLNLEFPRSQRDSFTLTVPGDYLVEDVTGDNVRSWQVRETENGQRIAVTLLKETIGKETMTVRLARYASVGQNAESQFEAPMVLVPGAILHQGELVVRRSPRLDVRVADVKGLSRSATPEEALKAFQAEMLEESPLGIRPFQSYRFAATPYQLALTAETYRAELVAETRALVKIGERDSAYEARVILQSQNTAVHRIRLILPESLDLQEVDCTGDFDWAVTQQDDRSLLTVYFAEGRQGNFSLDIGGKLPFSAGPDAIAAPRLEVLDTSSQNGYLVVQADPAYGVSVNYLAHCAPELIQRVRPWLSDAHLPTTRAVLSYSRPDFSAEIRTLPRQADVDVLTITNMRVTTREVQQLVYLEYRIRRAGVREVSFVLPVGMENANVKVRLLREKIIESVEGNPGVFRMRLLLQDEITGQLIVMVEQDRALTKGIHHTPIPELEDANVLGRFVVLESAGRDEVVVDKAVGLTSLNRQQRQWNDLTAILGSHITQAYLVQSDAPEHQLLIKTRQRETVESAGARIGLARTVMVVDGNGAYRAIQEYHVDNKTEQYLDVELPEDGQLWTVIVAGEPVKPIVPPDAGRRNIVQVPLFKTAEGDLDYIVEMKYAGELPPLGTLSRVAFPVPQTLNIKPELSQVRLRLPEAHRWFGFGGTARLVKDERDLVAGFLSYKTKQVRELTKLLDTKSGKFGRLRAANNLKQLNLSLQTYRKAQGLSSRQLFNERLAEEFASNTIALDEATRQIEQVDKEDVDALITSNRDRLLSRFDAQEGKRAKNVVTQLGDNFAQPQTETAKQPDGSVRFNYQWFDKAKLQESLESGKKLDKSRISDLTVQGGVQPGLEQLFEPTKPGVSPREVDRTAPEVSNELLRLYDQQQQTDADSEVRRGGELQQQLERYEQKLKEQNVPAAPSIGRGLGTGYGAPSSGQARGSRYYQEQPPLPGPAGAPGGMAGMGGGMGGGGFGGYGRMAGEDEYDEYGMGLGESGAEIAEFELPQAVPVMGDAYQATGLASLDIKLPQRGVEYLFTTPRGDVEISARSIATPHYQRMLHFLLIVGVVIGAAIACQVTLYLHAKLSRPVKGLALVGLGFLSLLLGVLPIAGLIAFLVGVVILLGPLFTRLFQAVGLVAS
jgi:hypothetical protein